ncbi:MAG: class I SAM-dependent methyltransferase [Candidatus Krumholzibacteria bacterium]
MDGKHIDRVRSRHTENGKMAEMTAINHDARHLFASIANDYERWARILSLGQDPRWRREMIAGLDLPQRSLVLDVAAGTGAITRLVEARGFDVIALDQSPEMLQAAKQRGATTVQARAESLPFPDESFDGLTFSYLLRYVTDPRSCMEELVRVVRPGGMIAMVEFGRPRRLWGPPWWFYTRVLLPAAGCLIGPGWRRVGSFLGPSIEDFHRRFPGHALVELWRSAGLTEVRARECSLGGSLLMWGCKP